MSRKRLQVYEADGLRVTYDPNVCTHAAACVRGLPQVFNPAVARWVRLDQAAADEIAGVVARCPTGALQAELRGAPEAPAAPATIQVTAKGAYLVRGDVTVQDHEGRPLRTGPRMALCRCGQSANKPWCDGTHRTIGFADPGVPLGSPEKGR